MSEHQNNIESTSNQVDVEKPVPTSDSAENYQNSDFENLVADATRTKEQERAEEQAEKIEEAPTALSAEKAGDYALKALDSVCGLGTQLTGKPITFDNFTKMAFAALVTPCIMKYGATIEKLLSAPKQADLNSRVPEAMATVGVGAAGYLIYQQLNAPEQTESKPEQAAQYGD